MERKRISLTAKKGGAPAQQGGQGQRPQQGGGPGPKGGRPEQRGGQKPQGQGQGKGQAEGFKYNPFSNLGRK